MESKVVAEYYMTGQYTDANALVEELLQLDRKDVCDIVVNLEQKVITTASIPQYSSFDDETTNLIQFLRMTVILRMFPRCAPSWSIIWAISEQSTPTMSGHACFS